MTEQQKLQLLAIAREVIAAAVNQQPIKNYKSDDSLFNENRGCFVTMHNNGRLRGCIGQFTPRGSLLETIVTMAVSATQDGRFVNDPVSPAELNEIDIEISVLSPLVKTKDPLSLELGVHGIYIQRGHAGGCFLPQVATETGWSKEEFLTQCCYGKAGMAPDAWKQADTDVFLFTAEVFGEKKLADD
ncbi:MAG: AmmeMemoRadiSam system protein A [Phycisphaerae bacterium]|nr:AmmeMemoRadiSam system protein A [Phycisphaerae bacterium]